MINREVFAESVEILKKALDNETFGPATVGSTSSFRRRGYPTGEAPSRH